MRRSHASTEEYAASNSPYPVTETEPSARATMGSGSVWSLTGLSFRKFCRSVVCEKAYPYTLRLAGSASTVTLVDGSSASTSISTAASEFEFDKVSTDVIISFVSELCCFFLEVSSQVSVKSPAIY